MGNCRSLVAPLLGMTFLAAEARAQCPDGSPPPCPQRVASAARVVNPPLDDRTWIVMPFDNLSNSADIEWLRTASANLLYLDMSRWQDIRVVDDERVADLLREAPATTGPTLSLASALTIARRAGAGKLVMGDMIKSGNRTMLTAKIFDVRGGQRTNTVRDETSVQDSVIPLFGRLARRILRVDPPPGSSVGMVGTTSVGAYQEYSQGVQKLNRFDIDGAKEHLRRALQLDSTFALAHFKLTTALGWFEGGDPRRLAHAEASWRFGNSLPPRERRLIEAQLWHIRGDLAKANELYAAGVKADSFDVEAWHGLGEANYHNHRLVLDAGDTTRVRFRGDWNLAMHAFERVLALDASYHVAYPHLVDVARGHLRGGCLFDADGRCTGYTALVRFRGDSIVTAPVQQRDSALFRGQMEEFIRQGGMRRHLARADTMSLRWLSVASGEAYAQLARAMVLSRLGRVKEAADLLARLGPVGGWFERTQVLQARIELALKALNTKEARRLYDSVRTVPAAAQIVVPFNDGVLTSIALGDWIGRQLGWTFGQFATAEPILRGFAQTSPSPVILRYRRGFARMMAGFPDSAVATQLAQFDDAVTRATVAAASRGAVGLIAWSLNVPREPWPAIDTTLPDLKMRLVAAKMRKDVAALQASARMFDSTSRAIAAAYLPDTAMSLIAVEAYLAAGDSLAALRTLRFALDSTLATRELFAPIATSGTVFYAAILPRLMLQRADLAAGLGQKDEARLWYGRILELWSAADAEVQPIVARVRRAVAALGG